MPKGDEHDFRLCNLVIVNIEQIFYKLKYTSLKPAVHCYDLSKYVPTLLELRRPERTVSFIVS